MAARHRGGSADGPPAPWRRWPAASTRNVPAGPSRSLIVSTGAPFRGAPVLTTQMRRALLLCLLALSLAPAGAAARMSPNLVVGIGDQKPEMFTDARFAALGMADARRTVAWDALSSPWQRAELDTWMAAARAAGVAPLLTFEHSRIERRSHRLPSPRRLAHVFRRLRHRYPWAKQYATWNEANYCGEKTCHRPRLVARYYRALKRACPSCTILAAELLDVPGMTHWVRRFNHFARVQPARWGLHNYLDANYLRRHGTRALLRVTTGEVWFTETGGIVSRHNGSPVKLPEGTRHAADVTSFVFKRLAPLSPRIKRIYLYQWSTVAGTSWDSGLVAPNGKERPALDVLKKVLNAPGNGKPAVPPGQAKAPGQT